MLPAQWLIYIAKVRIPLNENYLCNSLLIDKMHRDLKSYNILVTKEWVAKVCDFGLCRDCNGDAATTLAGSLLWMAPEVIMGRYGRSADVFSYGMYLLLPPLH